MNDVTITLKSNIDDAELQAIHAIVYLIERTHFAHGTKALEPIQKDRVARYLFDRYTIQQKTLIQDIPLPHMDTCALKYGSAKCTCGLL